MDAALGENFSKEVTCNVGLKIQTICENENMQLKLRRQSGVGDIN